MEIVTESDTRSKAKMQTTQTTFTDGDFDKHNLFFRSLPNEIGFDRVKFKNTGTTCIYFKWQKYIKSFNLAEKKSDGIDRFFCHYVLITFINNLV
jgi:hypothetical protein